MYLCQFSTLQRQKIDKEVSVIWTNEYELLSLTRYYPTITWKIALMSSHLLWDQNQEVSTYYFVSRPASA